jgi:hypothetical protein
VCAPSATPVLRGSDAVLDASVGAADGRLRCYSTTVGDGAGATSGVMCCYDSFWWLVGVATCVCPLLLRAFATLAYCFARYVFLLWHNLFGTTPLWSYYKVSNESPLRVFGEAILLH